MPDAATLDALETEAKEHPITRLKREHGELTAKVAELEAALADAKKANPPAPPHAPSAPFSPAQVIPTIVASLLAGGRQQAEVEPLAVAAWHISVSVCKQLEDPNAAPAKVASTKAIRDALQAEWVEADKRAQGEYFEVKKKTDAMNRSSSVMEKENLAREIDGHLQRGKAHIAESLVIEAKIKSLTA